jgi:glycosyltransferase involved in cell wall biosynthesis
MHFVPDTWLHRLLNNCGQFIPARVNEFTFGLLSHQYTQVVQRRVVGRPHREHQIDVVQEPTPVSATFPSLMFGLGARFAMGPLNAAVKFPLAFRWHQNPTIDLFIALGHQFVDFFNGLLPGKIKAETVLVANDRTQQARTAQVPGKIIELVENGVDFSLWRSDSSLSKAAAGQVHFIFLGRPIDSKAVDLLLEAFAAVVAQTDGVLEIIGDGDIRGQLEAQTDRLGIDSSVVFSGWLSQQQCDLKLQQADALVLPSLREGGGAVVLEAMAVGLPVIATNWGGPADYLNSSCGILVEPASQEGFVKGLTDAMLKLAQSPELLQSMGSAGGERVREHFDWERKVDRILEIYQQTIDACPKP